MQAKWQTQNFRHILLYFHQTKQYFHTFGKNGNREMLMVNKILNYKTISVSWYFGEPSEHWWQWTASSSMLFFIFLFFNLFLFFNHLFFNVFLYVVYLCVCVHMSHKYSNFSLKKIPKEGDRYLRCLMSGCQ